MFEARFPGSDPTPLASGSDPTPPRRGTEHQGGLESDTEVGDERQMV